jgi:hypothetical protein
MWSTDAGSSLPSDNGVQVTFDERSGKYLALYNAHLLTASVRVADDPWGPWSEPVTWFDCRRIAEDVYPHCYTGELHRQLSRDGGDTLYVTVSSQRPYDVTLMELHLGDAVHEWRAGDGTLHYAFASPGEGYEDRGVAFYAADRGAPGLAALYEVDGSYLLSRDTDTAPPFYAYAAASDGPVRTKPVYRYEREGVSALSVDAREGWTRGEIAFHVPCMRALVENSDCAE